MNDTTRQSDLEAAGLAYSEAVLAMLCNDRVVRYNRELDGAREAQIAHRPDGRAANARRDREDT